MAPLQSKKRKSEHHSQDSPIKKRKLGLSATQKKALIDNLQLEITERARRLRAQYNVQAQQLRSRVEMRVNRIPTALRKKTMGELLAKTETQIPRHPRSPFRTRPPPVPAKDGTSPKPIPRKPLSPNLRRGQKRVSDEIGDADDKENSVEPVLNPKKKLRGGPSTETLHAGQVLSPTSSNVRIVPRAMERPQSPVKTMLERPASPMKSAIARPASPVKGHTTKGSSSNIISSMVEKAKATRGAATRTRNATVSSTTSSNSGTSGTRTRKPPVPPAPTTATTRARRKVSATSQTSESSTGTVVRKTTASRAAATKAAPATKRTVMGTIKSATTKKAPAAKATTAPATTGRTLRKR